MTDETSDRTRRREYLAAVSGLGAAALSGCLRLAEDGATTSTEQGVVGTDAADDAATAVESTGPGGGTYDVDTFYLDSFDSDGTLREDAALDFRTDGQRVEQPGTWQGDRDIFARQTCATYAFDVLDGDSVVATSDERVLIFGYQYILDQSPESCFITYQPSVGRDWDHRLRLTYQDEEYTVTPTILADRGVFEFDLTEVDRGGRYAWTFEITPTHNGRETGFTIDIGTFDESLVSVPPNESARYPTRSEAIANAGRVANQTATAVGAPASGGGDGLQIDESGHGGGSSGDQEGYFISRDAAVDCRSGCRFGAGTNRRFRIHNRTAESSLTFTPTG